MSAEIRDPVSRVRQTFATEGESLVVDNWLEPGGTLPAHYHPRQVERWSVIAGEVTKADAPESSTMYWTSDGRR